MCDTLKPRQGRALITRWWRLLSCTSGRDRYLLSCRPRRVDVFCLAATCCTSARTSHFSTQPQSKICTNRPSRIVQVLGVRLQRAAMPLQKRKAGVPLGPKGSNGRRLKTQAEKEATKRKKEARKADLARQARDPRLLRQARDRLFASQVSSR